MIYYSFEEFRNDAKELAARLKNEFDPEAIVAIARGGMTLGHAVAMILDNRNLFTLNSIHYDGDKKLDEVKIFNIPDLSKFKSVILVDDMIDSGESMSEILRVLKRDYPSVNFKVATIFYKKRALLKPDFCIKEAKEWIEFFWENLR
ncbi:MAG: phosphoribosyltransferase [Campylobacter sp.]|nr:phosphoribosyltransferase [Campylobacter sp.]